MQALILAGGLGTRLRAIAKDKPKPMVEIERKPFLEYQVEFLKANGIEELVFCVGYKHEQIQAYFAGGQRWGVRIRYSIEPEQLGTGGAIRHAESFIDDDFLLLNGDTYFDADLQELIRFHRTKKTSDQAIAGSIALTRVEDASRYGSITTDRAGRVISFDEKISGAEGFINGGIYLLEKSIVAAIPEAKKVSLEREIFPDILQNRKSLYGFKAKGFFVDIGTPAGFNRFINYIKGYDNHDHTQQGPAEN